MRVLYLLSYKPVTLPPVRTDSQVWQLDPIQHRAVRIRVHSFVAELFCQVAHRDLNPDSPTMRWGVLPLDDRPEKAGGLPLTYIPLCLPGWSLPTDQAGGRHPGGRAGLTYL